MSEVSLKRFYFALFDGGLTFKNFEISGVYQFLHSNSSYTDYSLLCTAEKQTFPWVSSQNGLTPFWSIWDIWDLSSWNIKKIIRKYVILLIKKSQNTALPPMSLASLERYYFVLYDCALSSKMSKMALKSFYDKTLNVLDCEIEYE